MKRFFKTFLALIFIFCCFGVVGCGDKYGDLKISLSFSYSQHDIVETLSDGTKRVKSTYYAFDEGIDGNYTFYVSQEDINKASRNISAPLQVSYSGTPSDFNFGTTVSSSNTEVLSNSTSTRQEDNSAYLDITIVGQGQSELMVINNETGLTKSVYVDVKVVEDELCFTQENIAFANVVVEWKSNKINLLQYVSTSDKSNLSFKFGKKIETKDEESFQEYTDSELLQYGLSFQRLTNELSLDKETTLKNIDVQATYISPLGDTLVAYTSIRFLENITNFTVYEGQTFNDKTSIENSLEFHSNLGDYKYLVLTAKTNGEKVKFDIVQDDIFPFEFDFENIVYLNNSNTIVADYTSATTAYQIVKLISSENTEDISIYGEDRSYNLILSCDYADYDVPNYPKEVSIETKAYDLIKFFKINDTKTENSQTFENALEYDIFLNSSNVLGEEFSIGIADPTTILAENSKFNIEFYDSTKNKYNDITTLLDVYCKVGNNEPTRLTNDKMTGLFDKDTIFYVKPKDESTLTEGQQIYMAFRAQKPAEKQAVAFCVLTVRQGLKNISSINYSYNQFKIVNGDYVWEDNVRTTETISDESLFEEKSENVYEATKTINLDTDVPNISAMITLSCEPSGASLSNLSIVSSNPSLLEVTRVGADNEFSIVVHDETQSGGEATITISATNLPQVYKINVKIYNAINNLVVTLSDTTNSAIVSLENGNVKTAKVEYNKLYNLSTVVQPVSSKYEIKYSLYKKEETEGNLLGTLSCEYSSLNQTITSGSSDEILSDNYFKFRASDFAFIFYDVTTEQYILVMEIINANGAIISRKITLSSYIPLASFSITNLKNDVYNANDIYFENKVLAKEDGSLSDYIQKDDSIFGVKVSTAGKNGIDPTYSFNNNGYIEINVDGDKEKIVYQIENGQLQSGALSLGKYVKALSITPIDGYFVFRLQEDYEQNEIGKIFVTAKIEQFENENKRTIETSTSINILPVSQVLGITSSIDDVNIKQGASTDFDVTISGDNIKNDNLLTRVVGVKEFRGKTYYVESDELFVLNLINSTYTSKKYNLSVNSNFLGDGFVLIAPQDKITTQEKYNKFFNFTYEPINNLTKDEFIKGFFYTKNNEGVYSLATKFDEEKTYITYYLKVFNNSNLNIFGSDLISIHFSISDGLDIPYQISTLDELIAIGQGKDSITKNYVLTKDIEVGTKTFTPIGNYYEVALTEESFSSSIEKYFIKQDESFVEAPEEFDANAIYYAYGFNGSLSGKYVIPTLDGGEIVSYYGIKNIRYNNENTLGIDGIFAQLGSNGRIENVSLSFDSYKMTLSQNSIVGGLVATNYGKINNVFASFSGYSLIANGNLTFGGIVGANYGSIDNSTLSSSFTTTGTISINSTNATLLVGGYVGANYGSIIGASRVNESNEIAYDDLGFDCKLILNVDSTSAKWEGTSNIGIVAGYSSGTIKNFSVNGQVKAPNMDNVGGLVGKIEYSAFLGSEANGNIVNAIQDSYSIALVEGREYVGGAIGQVVGTNENKIYIDSISAENYDTQSYANRSFVKGENIVGGLIGLARYTQINYSYVASYYDLSKDGFDVVATKNQAGGFIGSVANSNIQSSGCYVNVNSAKNGGLFVSISRDITIDKVFAYGYGFGLSQYALYSGASYTNSYSVIYDTSNSNKLHVNNTITQTKVSNISEGTDWKKENDLLYYPLKDGKPLVSIAPTITVNIKEQTNYEKYIDANSTDDNKSVILFLAQNSNGNYTSEQLEKLNTIDIEEFLQINVSPQTYKTSKISISTTQSNGVLSIKDGKIILQRTGSVTLKIASKLSSTRSTSINVVVMAGASDIKLYPASSISHELKDSTIEMIKNSAQTINVKTLYERVLEGKSFSLKSATQSDNIGVRIIVRKESIGDENIENLNNIFQFENLQWNWSNDSSYRYVDIEKTNSFDLFSKSVELSGIDIEYIPFIKKTIGNNLTTILLDAFKGSFNLSIKSGSTKIVLENNVSSNITMSQLEKLAITLTIDTDFDSDVISYTCDNENINKTGLHISSVKKASTESGKVSYTFTFWYENKLETLEDSIVYNFEFYASSNPIYTKQITLTILPQKNLKSISSHVYSELNSDFPQKRSQNNVIYNGKTALLTLEVFPYLADFSSLKLRYETTSARSLSISQLQYNASQLGTDKAFSINLNYGTVYDGSGSVVVQKSSAQDIYLSNDNGVYSYSRFFFFSLLIPSNLPDRCVYNLFVDVIDRDGKIILTQTIVINTLSKTNVELSFDEKFKGQDGVYYLPVNTKQKLDVVTTNQYSVATWKVTAKGFDLTNSQKEIFTPYFENGSYYVNIMNYDNNQFSTDLIGKTITLELTLDNAKTVDPKEITFVVSLFSVTNISVENVEDGYMTLKNSTTTPLYVNVEAEYDESLKNANSWYSNWYTDYIKKNDKNDSLYKLLTNSGYSISENFSDYILVLQEKIAKASYDSSSTSSIFTSGVWFYKDSEGSLIALKSGSTYNNKTFGVEKYNNYVAVYGYEEDTNSTLNFSVRLSYSSKSGGELYKGVPNVTNYFYDTSLYASVFNFSQNFIVNFVSALSMYNPIPVSNAKEFLELSTDEGGDYRLVADIVLTDFTPFEANFKSFDGNNYTIYIESFASSTSTSATFGLFTNISSETMVSNVTVHYTSEVEYDSKTELYTYSTKAMSLDISSYSSVSFGGLCVNNNGVITNCKTTGAISITSTQETNSSNLMAGLVANNTGSGYITNSKVKDFELSACGEIGGFVGKNAGMIVSSAFDSSQIVGLSYSLDIGGFAYENSGKIAECYVEGTRATTDTKIWNTGSQIISNYGGRIGNFVFRNSATINDCYANIHSHTSQRMSGFVYEDTNSSVISRCYSIFNKESGDNTMTIFPFVGPYGEANPPKVVVNGTLNNCYYLTSSIGGYWSTDSFFDSTSSTDATKTPSNKQAIGLDEEDFGTHDSFVNFDLSLSKNTITVGTKSYYYVDGYTWVIIEGKPLIVSTLVDTISMQKYIGKTKNYYNEEQILYVKDEGTTFQKETTKIGLDGNITYTKYYKANEGEPYTEQDLAFTETYDNSLLQYTYNYFMDDGNELQIVASLTSSGIEFKSAQYGSDNKQILDIKLLSSNSRYEDIDDNFRANDTIFIETNESGEITKITLKVLESASYSYSNNVEGTSESKGARTNPYILYNYDTLIETLSEDTDGNFYRLVRDVDLENKFVKTSSKIFKGVLQGNHMTLSNLTLSYFNNKGVVGDSTFDTDSFGFFAGIATSTKSAKQDTVISNLTINVSEVISNSHKYVGALAGRLNGEASASKKIFLNNINIVGNEDSHYVAGKNIVGGLAGYATGYVIIKDINTSVSVNATYAETLSNNEMLYIASGSKDKISYAGGVVGIFDVIEVVDPSTLKNYNANNVTIDTSCVYQGNIVGSAFGLVGTNAIVNYVNVLFDRKSTSFISASNYAGGLVGENRGRIISSSVKYLSQDSMIDSITPALKDEDHIFFEISGKTLSGIGGLVGLNNGGFISNSISTINVRNKYATVAGGAVGRMVGGGLINVVATGAVLSGKIVGGLVGTINDSEILTNGENPYNSSAFIDFSDKTQKDLFNQRCVYAKGKNLEDGVTTLISSCVAGNNYLSTDAMSLYLLANKGTFAGFIGVIACSSTDNTKNSIEYWQKSYFVNTLYSSTNSTTVLKYLNATYYSNILDFSSYTDEVNILTSDDEQMVYPYSVQDFYYEAQDSGVYYTVNQYANNPSEIDSAIDINNEHDKVILTIYEITQVSDESIKNASEIYSEITYEENGSWTTPYSNRGYNWYKARFGKFYYKTINGDKVRTSSNSVQDGQYVLITEDMESSWSDFYKDENGYPKIYYMSSPVVTHFDYTRTYTNTDSEFYLAGGKDSSRSNGYFASIEELKSQKYLIINGLRIPISISEMVEDKTISGDEEIVNKGTYTCYPSLVLPNNCTISKFVFNVERKVLKGNSVQYVLTDVVVTYSATNVPLDTSDLTHLSSSSVSSTTTYKLKIASKQTIYNQFDNGYWAMDDGFYSDSFSLATKYPTNLEIAETYLWSSFASSNLVQDDKGVVNIFTAEQLAKLAQEVNSGISYQGITIKLQDNIDLSGKYWIPIGTETNPFKGTFDGNKNSIQYVSVNQNSTTDSTYLDYVGLFGVIEDATISNLNLRGGEVVGSIAGGLVGLSKNSTISNINNRNSAVGLTIAGGIVGEMNSGSLNNCSNDANVSLMSDSALDLYLGGLVGKIENSSISGRAESFSTNSGKVSITSNYTNYVANKLVSLYVGGIAGKTINTAITYAKNTGEVSVKTNSHKTFVGGIVGDVDGKTVSNVKNNGNISVEYSSYYKVVSTGLLDAIKDDLYERATLDVGGVAGRTNRSLSILSNLSSVSLKSITETTSHISLGGLVGRIKYENEIVSLEQSYNSGEISSSLDKSSTIGVGGLVGTIDLNGIQTESSKLVTIKNNYNNGYISSNSICLVYMGGIAGYVFNNGYSENDYVLIQNNLNIGYVTIYSFVSSKNALGAIIGYGKYCYLTNPDGDYTSDDVNARKSFDLNNYYLSGSAYSSDGNNSSIFTGYCEKVNNYYTSKQEELGDNFYRGDDNDKFFFAKALSSSDLKEKSTYAMRKKVDETVDVTYVFDFASVWEFKYGTWYPTLKDNASTAYWIDNAREVSKSSSTYFVSSAEELVYLSKIINNGQIDTTGITIKLTKSIDLSNKFFTPIGTESNPFKGTFDGGLYEIKNLTIDGKVKYIGSIGEESLEDCEYGGLFGVVSDATIKNVGLESPIIDNVEYAGGIVAKATNSSLSYLFTDSTTKSLTLDSKTSYISGNFGAGGLVCILTDCKDNGSAKKGLYNSFNNVFVITKQGYESTRIGALVGEAKNSYIYDCYNGDYGLITVADNTKYSGIIGRIDKDSEIRNIFSLCTKLETRIGTTPVTIEPSMYVISDGKVLSNETRPSYANLTGEDKEEIWTKDYSLNSSGYPSLRGLNREWKNLSSETLSSFSYSNNSESKNIVYNYIDSYKKVYDEDGQLLSGKIDYSLANFAKDSFYDVEIDKIYLISSAEELIWLSNNVNNGSLSTSGVEFMLISDIDLSGRYFTPIGLNRTYSFKGIFNFNGHIIKGLTIDSSYTYSGLFGYTENALIANGYLIDAFIKINIKSANAKAYSGALVGYAENTSIKNMVVSSSLSTCSNGSTYVGGLVGYYCIINTSGSTGAWASSTIENVRVYGGDNADVDGFTADEKTTDSLGQEIIIQKNIIKEGSIDQNAKKINVVGYSVDGGAYVGGVAGYSIVSVEKTDNLKDLISYATVDIGVAGISLTSAKTAHVGVGGVLGYGAGLVKINACEVLSGAVIKSYSNKFDSAGGIVGYNTNGEIRNCKFTGYVEARVSNRDSVEQSIWSYVGGIVGTCNGGIVSSCYSNGSTILSNISNNNYSKGLIIGFATGKSYASDSVSICDVNDTNGFGDYIVGQEENIIGTRTYSDVYKKSSEATVSEDNGFSASLWKGNNLLSKKIFIMGGGSNEVTAYTTSSDKKNLLTEGAVNSPAGIKIDNLSDLKLEGKDGTFGFVYVAGDLNKLAYKYDEIASTTGTDVNVSSSISSYANDTIVIFIVKK